MLHKTLVFTLGLALRESTSLAALDAVLRLEEEAAPGRTFEEHHLPSAAHMSLLIYLFRGRGAPILSIYRGELEW